MFGRYLQGQTSAEHLACRAGADGLATAHSQEKTTLVGPELVAMSSTAELERFFQLTQATLRIRGQLFSLELVWLSYASNLDAEKSQRRRRLNVRARVDRIRC